MKEHYAWNFSACTEVLAREIALLKRTALVQEEARSAAAVREWSGFAKRQRDAERLGREFDRLEAERCALFAALGESLSGRGSPKAEGLPCEGTPFYALCAVLTESERIEMGKLYRELKFEAVKVKMMQQSFVQYLEEIKNVAAAFIESAFPSRGGKLYSALGSRIPADMRSMIVNRQV
ncbi:MAG: hypothetical protein LBR16_05790 [Treponema sp.]|jgi:hypothetical protein|nr:hypothetical protein [Treponema sp.]